MTDQEKKAMADYIRGSQPALKKLAALESRIGTAVDHLIAAGLVEAHMKSAKVKQLLANPSLLCELPGQVFTATKVAAVGSAGSDDVDTVGGESLEDQFARRILNR